MSRPYRAAAIAMLLLCGLASFADAGMPTPLPTHWTVDNPPPGRQFGATGPAALARWQAISFFIACLLACAGGVKLLWNAARRDVPWLPRIGYGRALSLVMLWGLAFVIVLTIISGARELMTPGAWRKQGWTYQLASGDPPSKGSTAERRAALETLRLALWQYAATHNGQFPPDGDEPLDADLWNLPGWAGLRFLYVPGRAAEEAGRLLVHEPDLGPEDRLVLLTNGMIGTMTTAEIDRALGAGDSP